MSRSSPLLVPLGCGGLALVGCAIALSRLDGCGLPAALLMGLILALGLCAALLSLRRCSPRLLVACGVAAALLLVLRILCFPVETSDYTSFLRPWTAQLRAGGHFRALGAAIGNYNVPYLTLLALFSCFPVPELALIKLSSVLFDLLLAACAAGLVRQAGQSENRAALCFVLTLLLPTVFINGAVWGQCDSIYVSLGLLGLLLCLQDRPVWGMAAFAFSFAFKLQGIFLLPVVALLLFAGKLRWFHLPVFPAAYLLAVSPALIAGRGFWDTLLIYVSTASTAGSGLNYNSPSVYSLLTSLPAGSADSAAKGGIIAAFCLCLAVILLFFLRMKHITKRALIFAALLLTCGLPLLLPHMHDRYFYFCDVLTLVFACICPPAAVTVLCSQFASLLGYHAYFFMRYLYPMRYGFCALAFTLFFALFVCVEALFAPPPDAPELPPSP